MKAPLNTRPTVLQDAIHTARGYMLKVQRGVTAEDIMDPTFWNHVASQLREFDRIEVVSEDKAWWGLFLVVSAGAREARLMQLSFAEGKAQTSKAKPDLEVKFRGLRKFSLVRIADGEVIEEDIPTKEEAEQRLAARAA